MKHFGIFHITFHSFILKISQIFQIFISIFSIIQKIKKVRDKKGAVNCLNKIKLYYTKLNLFK